MRRRLLYLMSLSIVAVLGITPAAFAQTKPLSCADFVTQEAAQKAYSQGIGNPSRLDPDADGEACESNERLVEMAANSDFGAWAQAAAAVVALATLFAIYWQIRKEGLRHSADLILELRNRYHSQEVRKTRQASAKSIKKARDNGEDPQERATKNNTEDELLDFFNRIGLLVQRRALDKSMVASAFYNSVNKYCWANKGYITAIRDDSSTTWEELSYLHREIYLVHKSNSVRVPTFLLSETEKDSARSARVPRGLRWAIKFRWRWKVPRRNDFQGVGNEAEPKPEKLDEFLAEDEGKLLVGEPEDKALSTLYASLERERGRTDLLEKELEDAKNWLGHK